MHNAGLVVAYNSDDAEMSRRLNQKQPKAVKYGNVQKKSLEICHFKSLLLHIDDKVGSIKLVKMLM
jgi:hypothetical protein